MVEEILPSLFRIEVPLPRNPLKSLNSYVIKGPDRNLMIDTGMNRPECLNAVQRGLSELAVDLAETDFFITHLHADHLALVSSLATETSTVYFNAPDAAVMTHGSWEPMLDYAGLNGFPRGELRAALEHHPGYKYGPSAPLRFTIVHERDTIGIGDYLFHCVETPGHTEGHMCLYEPSQRVLVAGDHILGDITPNISCYTDHRNPLVEYLASLDKVYQLDVRLVLPGHRALIADCRARIEELQHHHEVRANEVLSILDQGAQDAFRVAAQMTWEMTYSSWQEFPVSQKWFATGEAIAHLRYLEHKEMVQRELGERKSGKPIYRYKLP